MMIVIAKCLKINNRLFINAILFNTKFKIFATIKNLLFS